MAHRYRLAGLRVSEQTIRNKLGLTPAEAKLACRLARGMTVREASEAANIGYETGRTLLKSIFRKTGVNRQTGLILLLAKIATANP
jgi:DNA-binding CsgD family transcriptional regulator